MSGDAAFKYTLLYICGLLPFVKIDHHEVATLPYLTRDYLHMKIAEAKALTPFFFAYLLIVGISNRYFDGLINHLNKREIHTNYWVINDDDEIR